MGPTSSRIWRTCSSVASYGTFPMEGGQGGEGGERGEQAVKKAGRREEETKQRVSKVEATAE